MAKIHRAYARYFDEHEEITIQTNDIPSSESVKLPEKPTWKDIIPFQVMIKKLAKEKMGLHVRLLHDNGDPRALSFFKQIHGAFYAHLPMDFFMDCWTADVRYGDDVPLPEVEPAEPSRKRSRTD